MIEASNEELRLFRLGGHNAQTLAVLCVANRLGVSAAEAREILESATQEVSHG